MEWQPIETAPKDGRVILVDDTQADVPWAAARWLSGDEWEGWIYDDELLLDHNPLGPQPRYWIDVPDVPERQP